MARLFNKFERLEMQKNKGIEGTGLGLAISNNLVRMMGGEIKVTSQYNEGSVFTATVIQEVAGFVNNKLAVLDTVQSTATHFILKKYKDHGTILAKQYEDTREMTSL